MSDTVSTLARKQVPAYLWNRWGIRRSEASLCSDVTRRSGPPYTKICGRVTYRPADLDRWVEENTTVYPGK
jgi:hypothetical protein